MSSLGTASPMDMKPRFLLMILLAALVGCDGASGDGPSVGEGPAEDLSTRADPTREAVNAAHRQTFERVAAFSQKVLGAGGVVEQGVALAAIELGDETARGRYTDQSKALASSFDDLERAAAAMMLSESALLQARRSFYERQQAEFAVGAAAEASADARLDKAPTPRFLLHALIVGAAAISAYRTYKAIDQAIDASQAIVGETAAAGEKGRAALAQALADRGAEVPEGASAEQLTALFKSQGRDARRQIANEMREFNLSAMGSGEADGDGAAALAEQDRQHQVEAANALGKVAVESVVSANQAITGGVGDAIGGVQGASVELILNASEMDPMSIVERHVTVSVASTQTETVAVPAPPTEAEHAEAEQRIQALATGQESAIGSTDLRAALETLWARQLNELSLGTTGLLQLPVKIVWAELDLEEVPGSDAAAPSYSGQVAIPALTDMGATSGVEFADISMTLSGFAPRELESATIGADYPLDISTPPLLGTLSASATPLAASDGHSQKFAVTASIRRVYPGINQCYGAVCSSALGGTTLFLDAENGAVTARRQFAETSGDYTFEVEVFGEAALTLRRGDTGESYLFKVAMEAPVVPPEGEDPPSTPLEDGWTRDPTLIGTWIATGEDSDATWSFESDGRAKQMLYGVTYDWTWQTKEGVLRVSSVAAAAAFHDYNYKLEGGLLYLWVESAYYTGWSVPYRRKDG